MKFANISIDKRLPFITYVTGDNLKKIEESEEKTKAFGQGHTDPFLVEKPAEESEEKSAEFSQGNPDLGKDEEHKQESEKKSSSFGRGHHELFFGEEYNEEPYGDEEAYCAVLELAYNKILTEKTNMEVAIANGMKRYPHSTVLKEWEMKMQELFYHEDIDGEAFNVGDFYNGTPTRDNDEFMNDLYHRNTSEGTRNLRQEQGVMYVTPISTSGSARYRGESSGVHHEENADVGQPNQNKTS